MKIVRTIPAPEPPATPRDPWFDTLLDGKLRLLTEDDWRVRYTSVRSASSGVKAAAAKRNIPATVAVRGLSLYVQALLGEPSTNGEKPAKRTRKAKST